MTGVKITGLDVIPIRIPNRIPIKLSPWTSSSFRAGSAADRPRVYLIAPTVNPVMKRSTKTL